MYFCFFYFLLKFSEELWTINTPDGLDIRSINYIQNFDGIKEIFDVGYNNWFTVDGYRSKWAIKDTVYKEVVECSLKEQNYLNKKNNSKYLNIYFST